MLEKLLIEQTKSRASRTGDNGLVESKNGAAIRKRLGFSHIGAGHAAAVDQFPRQYLNPHIDWRQTGTRAHRYRRRHGDAEGQTSAV